MKEFDVTRYGDNTLIEKYFDVLDLVGEDNRRVKLMKEELEGRDVLFEGYRIHDWTSGYRVRGCIHSFKILEDLKDYILNHQGIEPTEDGSMLYIERPILRVNDHQSIEKSMERLMKILSKR